ncbi:MAG: 1-acyl-sn-glycerol-3-phosphate acyltransferase [Clostridia bacterium]|nr:1-acyl-sn-glycerol-3-phosphate acyltransferase [Clostridia bacterium]
MKIGVKKLSYDKVMALPSPKRKKPKKPNMFFRVLIKLLSVMSMKKDNFTYKTYDMEKAGDEPCLIFMNHSSFVDLEIASNILFPKPFGIVCTTDGFVGKEWLMRSIGCIPTQKYVSDPSLISDMKYALKEKKMSVLMYPEASYTFDGCATTLPRRLGLLVKRLDVPLVMITTKGAFARQPLYNCLKLRKVNVSADVKCLLSRDEIKEKSVDEIDAIIDEAFSFDNFAWQQQNKVVIDEPERAKGLERILYKCPHCLKEGQMVGEGSTVTCKACGARYELDVYGYLRGVNCDAKFTHIPDWYNWEREQVRQELINGEYKLETDVDICMLVDFKCVYRVGDGRLVHDESGLTLSGCDGKLNFFQSATSTYGLYADYYWYELGDIICIGDRQRLYYCFPKGEVSVAKTRLAAEELYKIKRSEKKKKAVAK